MSADLRDVMPNGVSVGDWLGTAMTAARVCGSSLEAMRGEPGYLSESALRAAADGAAQALHEIVSVMDRYGYEHGCGHMAFGKEAV